MLNKTPESLRTLEFQKPTRYHADVLTKAGKLVTLHFSAHSGKEAKKHFRTFGKVRLFWYDK